MWVSSHISPKQKGMILCAVMGFHHFVCNVDNVVVENIDDIGITYPLFALQFITDDIRKCGVAVRIEISVSL